jgi:hypothetical protein
MIIGAKTVIHQVTENVLVPLDILSANEGSDNIILTATESGQIRVQLSGSSTLDRTFSFQDFYNHIASI